MTCGDAVEGSRWSDMEVRVARCLVGRRMRLLWWHKEEGDVSWGKERAAEGVGSIML